MCGFLRGSCGVRISACQAWFAILFDITCFDRYSIISTGSRNIVNYFHKGSVVSAIVFVLRHTLYWKGKIVNPNERLVGTAIEHFKKKIVPPQRTGKYI